MVETARRERIETGDRANPTRQWEVFLRDDPGDPLRHVGSVAAAGATEAHDHASRLFGWYAVDVWVCPADAVERYSTRGLEAETNAPVDGDESGETRSECDEPRVYPETEGEPRVSDR